MKKFIALAILPFVLLVAFAFQSPQDFNEKESVLMRAVLTYLNRMHFNPVTLDDAYSESVFDEYLERLDPNKRILLAAEVDQLKAFRTKIDDEVQDASFNFFDESVKVIDEADQRAHQIFQEVMAMDFDYQKEENIETDSEKTSHCDTDGELIERWRKVMKLQVMRDVLNKTEKQNEEDFDEELKDFTTLSKEAKSRLQKRMDRWFNRRLKSRRVDRLTSYMNSVTSLYDPHTNYLKPKDKQDFILRMSNRLEGIGARLTQDGDYVKVVDVVPGGPAWKQGILAVDDEIIKVAQEEEDAVEVVGWHIDDVIGLIRGKKGTHVRLIVRRVDNSEVEIPITRDIIVFDEGYVRSHVIEREDVKENIGYIMLPSFYFNMGQLGARNSGEDVKLEIQKLKEKGVDGIILDLRNNGGGSLRDVVEMSGLFIEKGPIVQVKSRDADPNILADKDASVEYDGPLVVMVNQGSASASEILAAAMQDYKRAVIVGNKTFGKGTVQRFFNLDRSVKDPELKPLGELKITTQKFFRINGGATQLEGVTPDIKLPDPYQHFSRGERDYDHAMVWSEIPKAKFEQQVYLVENLKELQNLSSARVDANTTFNRVDAYSKLLKENRDKTLFQLNYDEFSRKEKALDETLKQYDNLYPEIDEYEVEFNAVDYLENQADSVKMVRNDRVVKNLKKDVELEEAAAVIRDMIRFKQ